LVGVLIADAAGEVAAGYTQTSRVKGEAESERIELFQIPDKIEPQRLEGHEDVHEEENYLF
jgi:hypothetical protein